MKEAVLADWLRFTNGRFEQQMGGASVLTARALSEMMIAGIVQRQGEKNLSETECLD